MDWCPTADIKTLAEKARILASVRAFFANRQVMEVDTPVLSQATVTDEHLHCFETQYVGPEMASGGSLYLQTSPEYAMKRLLCAGSGSIYQISKAFRNEESGRFHNPEFTMLEWYRLGFDHHQLMAEVDQLLRMTLKCPQAEYMTYQQVFMIHLSIDPLDASVESLVSKATEKGLADIARDEINKDTLLQLLFSLCIESEIGQNAPCFVYDFPATQAALARISPDDHRVAERFEVYFKGIELANGFHELSDVAEQRQRFEQDNLKRQRAGRPEHVIDTHFMAALEAGLPECAGVALGVDRLMMLALDKPHIQDVLAFPVTIA